MRIPLEGLPFGTPGREFALTLLESWDVGNDEILRNMGDISPLVLVLCAQIEVLQKRIERLEDPNA